MVDWLKRAFSNFFIRTSLLGALAVLLFSLPSLSQNNNRANEIHSTSLENGRLMNMSEIAKMHGAVRDANPKIRNDEAATEIAQYFMKRYSTPAGPHIESVLSGLGASAGFGCQMAIREAFVKTGKVPEERAFVVVGTKDGKKFYFGDFLNQPLLNTNQISVWTLVAGGAIKAGSTTNSLPNISEILKHNASTIGTQEFGLPRLPKDHYPKELPTDALRSTWKDVESIQKKYQIDPQFWGWIPAEAAQQVILQYQDKLDPSLAAKIVMEAALPMSKVDPATSIAEK
jgi:hypothetical protein